LVSATDAQQAAMLVGLDNFRLGPAFAGIDGDAFSTVIIDTGIDLDHPFFGPDIDLNGIADRIVFQYDFADNDADASDRDGHGSHVASLIGSQDAAFTGVAPATELIVLKVFNDTGGGTFGDVERALQWVVANRDAFDIGVVNLSVGDGGTWPDAISLYGLGDELAALADLGVLVSAAAGNHYFDNGSTLGVAYPAADPAVLAVGAVWTADFGGPFAFSSGAKDFTTGPDRIVSFSQRDDNSLDVFAPGARLTGANSVGGQRTLQGTSQASAYLSGVASLAQEVAQHELGRRLTLEEFTTLVRQTGDSIIDGDNENDNVTNTGFTFPRVNVEQLANGILRVRNDAPVMTPAMFSLPENSVASRVVGTVHAFDPDPGTTLTYHITAGNEHRSFAIDAMTGVITVADSRLLDFETTPQFVLTAQVTDDGDPVLSGSAAVTITLTDINEPPIVTPATFNIPRRSEIGTTVGTVQASDPDAGTVLTYSITSGNEHGTFAIDPVTGRLILADRVAVQGGSREFELTVQATDNGSPVLSGTATIIINVTKEHDRTNGHHRSSEWPGGREARFTLRQHGCEETGDSRQDKAHGMHDPTIPRRAWVRDFVGDT
jgi:hypothetical protein